MQSCGRRMRVHISSATYDLLKNHKLPLVFEKRRVHVKGKGVLLTYFVSQLNQNESENNKNERLVVLNELSQLIERLNNSVEARIEDEVESVLKRLVQLCDSDHRENRGMFVSVGFPGVCVKIFKEFFTKSSSSANATSSTTPQNSSSLNSSSNSPKVILLALKVLRNLTTVKENAASICQQPGVLEAFQKILSDEQTEVATRDTLMSVVGHIADAVENRLFLRR